MQSHAFIHPFLRQFNINKSLQNHLLHKQQQQRQNQLILYKQPILNMINYNKFNFLKKTYYGLKARTKVVSDKLSFFQMARHSSIYNDQDANYKKDLSYRYSWFDLGHQSTLAEWDNVTDAIHGGSSTAQLWYDQKQKCIEYEGFVQTKDKDNMVSYPFINILRTFPSYIKLGPMRLFQVEAKTDGKPLQVHFELKSFIKGQVNIYGFILSKSTDWHTYEIPIENLILRGTEEDFHEGGVKFQSHRAGNYFSNKNHSSVFDKEFQSLKKILTTQVFNQNGVEICNVGFRLVSSQESQKRHIKIRNIRFAYKKGYEQFVDSYQSPYLYITNDKVINTQKVGVNLGKLQFLQNNLENVISIDTGDLKYSKDQKEKKKTKKQRFVY